MNFWNIHEKKVLIISILIALGLIAWLGYDLYMRGMTIGVDWSLAIIAFWVSSTILFISIFSESRVFLVIRNLAIYVLSGVSIYVSMGLKFDIEKMKQLSSNDKLEKNYKDNKSDIIQ